MTENDYCIVMVNKRLASVPVYTPQPGITVQWYTPGAERAWTAIQTAADRYNTIAQELFFTQFADKRLDLTERQCYLFDQAGRPAGTATAWERPGGEFGGYGQVHWVAVVPGCQGKGLGKVLMSIVCRRLVDLGYSRAFLETSPLRPAALHLYRSFGFEAAATRPW